MCLRLCDSIKSGAGKILGWGIRGLRLKLEGMDGFGMGLECVSLPFWASVKGIVLDQTGEVPGEPLGRNRNCGHCVV